MSRPELAIWLETCLSFLERYESEMPGSAAWIQIKSDIRYSAEMGYTQLMKAHQSELRQMGRELPRSERDRLDELLLERAGEGLNPPKRRESLRQILAKGKVTTEAEYLLIRGHIDEIEADSREDERLSRLVAMLDAYAADRH